ncbi:hypothetical protein [Luteolibacter sp. LG18]|uniref:hypothetical protein n=1 Tax=Luteolibacter sp. LG18 TaxID=2819286 RepID=UPI002B2D178C|nr:hypothetical protein llg_06930 [Luteolibacter sp. LG18]BCU79678.1 hypothetical protein llg_43930 [Luteolibacter sp. LG18]
MTKWTFQGSNGLAWDERKRTGAERGVPADVDLSWECLEAGRISWTQQRGTRPPDVGQRIVIYRDDEAVFTGYAKIRPWSWVKGEGATFKVELVDAMWILGELPLISAYVGNNGSQTVQPSIDLPQQSIRSSVVQLLGSQAVVQQGILDIPADFIVGNRSFSGGSWLAAMVEVLKPLSDHAVYLDYFYNPPTFNVVRRSGLMEEVTLIPGRHEIHEIADFTPRPDLKPAGVIVSVAERGANGKVNFIKRQVGGAGGGQVVAVSSPQLLPFIPPDDLPSVAIQTSPIVGGWAEAKVLDTAIAQAIANYGDITPTAISGFDFLYSSSGGTGSTNTTQIAPAVIKQVSSGAAVAASSWHRVTNGASLPDFLLTDYSIKNGAIQVMGVFRLQIYGEPFASVPNTLLALNNAGRVTWLKGYPSGGTAILTNYYIHVDYTIDSAINGPAPNLGYTSLTTVYQKAAYQYRTEPPGLAENLFNAQNFVPWEGQISFTPKMPWRRWIGCKINVIHPDDPDMATAGAIVQSQSVNLRTGVVTIRCGTPMRVAMSDVTGRYRASRSTDNIQAT